MNRSTSIFSSFSRSKQANRGIYGKKPVASRWRGTFTGLLLGGLLASLFMGHGFGGALLSWLFLGIVISLIVSFIRRKQSASYVSGQ